MSSIYTGDKKMHKHRDLIIAWANGAEIEERYVSKHEETSWSDFKDGLWMTDDEFEYRIKPRPKPDVVRYYHEQYMNMEVKECGREKKAEFYTDVLELTWDGETGKLKSAKVLK